LLAAQCWGVTNEEDRLASVPPVDELNRRREEIKEVRSELLDGVHDGILLVLEPVPMATGPWPMGVAAVRRMSLRQLLAVQPGWSRRRADTRARAPAGRRPEPVLRGVQVRPRDVPDVRGISGRTRIKQRLAPVSPLAKIALPAKWGQNALAGVAQSTAG